MSILDGSFAAAFVGLFAGVAAGFIVRRVTAIRRQERAEEELVRLLLQEELFTRSLADYVESIYRYGVPPESYSLLLRELALERVGALGPGGVFVHEALTQPSAVGRERYVQKLSEKAIDELVDIPLAELELAG